MSFLNLPGLGVAAGIAALAGILFLLQRLRVRHTEVVVPTTMFWAAAAREAPVGILRHRFRHFPAYLLALLICALLWIGFAGPAVEDEPTGAYRVLFLDGSAHTSDPDEFEKAKQQLVGDVAALPVGTREVIFGGAHNLALLRAGEDRLLLDKRLESLAPEAAPGGLDQLLRLIALNGYPDSVEVVVYGRAPVREETLRNLPAGFRVSRATRYDGGEANRGISALGVGEAASGAWDRVDVFIAVAATEGLPVGAGDLSVAIDGLGLDADRIERMAGNGFAVRDLPANGATLEVRLAGDDRLPIDDAARVLLPERKVIRVAVSPGAGSSIRNAIDADRGLALVTAGADVAVRTSAEAAVDGLPALVLESMAVQENAFEIGYVGERKAQLLLEEKVLRLGLNQIDRVGLATATARPISVSVHRSDRRSVSIWQELLTSDYNFTSSRSFPLFLSQSLRWLSGEEPQYAYLAAGRPVFDQKVRSSLGASAADDRFDALGADYVPGRAGSVQRDGAGDLEVSLLSDAVSTLSPGAWLGAPSLNPAAGSALADLVTWLILGVLLLLSFEWYLYQRGLMP